MGVTSEGTGGIDHAGREMSLDPRGVYGLVNEGGRLGEMSEGLNASARTFFWQPGLSSIDPFNGFLRERVQHIEACGVFRIIHIWALLSRVRTAHA